MVSVDGRWADKTREAAYGEIAHTALLDSGGYWTNRLGIRSVPTTLVLDSSGQVHYAAQGIERSQTLLGVVRGLMQGVSRPGVPVQLVFDDFPSRDPHLDDQLLDILRARGVRATLCGDAARRRASPIIVQRAKAEGHTLGAAFGTPSRDVVDPFDWKRPGGEELCRRVLCAAAPGKRILLHAGVRDTIEALPTMIAMLRERGLLGSSPSSQQGRARRP
jgi:peptidoglycan/xylan/chitin deacetylase (PgdA/CDA1 family)